MGIHGDRNFFHSVSHMKYSGMIGKYFDKFEIYFPDYTL